MRSTRILFTLGAAAALASPAAAQGRGRNAQPGRIPPGQMPPAGMCRVWIDGVPPGRQPAPTDCATALATRPANARVIYGDDSRAGKGGRYDKRDRDRDRDRDRGEYDRRNRNQRSGYPGTWSVDPRNRQNTGSSVWGIDPRTGRPTGTANSRTRYPGARSDRERDRDDDRAREARNRRDGKGHGREHPEGDRDDD